MVNQLLAGVHIAVAAEALALGIRAGADPQVLYDVICTSAGSSWMWQNRVPHILAGDDTPASAVNIFVKDLGIVLDQARALTFPAPIAATAHQLFLGAAALGNGAKDDAFVIRVWEALTGIELPPKGLSRNPGAPCGPVAGRAVAAPGRGRSAAPSGRHPGTRTRPACAGGGGGAGSRRGPAGSGRDAGRRALACRGRVERTVILYTVNNRLQS